MSNASKCSPRMSAISCPKKLVYLKNASSPRLIVAERATSQRRVLCSSASAMRRAIKKSLTVTSASSRK